LVRALRRAAIVAHDVASFEAVLQEGGYRIEIRRGPLGDPLGYKVARPADVTAAGEPIYYSGSKLAADLSLPRLLRRWADASGAGGEDGDEPVIAARAVVERARRVVADSRNHGGRGLEGDVEEVVYAGADVVAAVGWHGWEQAAVAFDHAARPPRGQFGSSSPLSIELRRVARRLVRRRTPVGADEIGAGATLAVALVALAWEIAAWRRRRAQPHQAVAADVAASVLAAWSARLPSTDAVRTLHPRAGLGSDTQRARVDPSGR